MNEFPDFMKHPLNRVPASAQNTQDIEGYYFTGSDGSRMAFWTCFADRVSQEHTHDFDEYMLCVSGRYTATVNGEEIVLNPGDEMLIPKGTLQGGSCIAGTRTIHCFGGKRISTQL